MLNLSSPAIISLMRCSSTVAGLVFSGIFLAGCAVSAPQGAVADVPQAAPSREPSQGEQAGRTSDTPQHPASVERGLHPLLDDREADPDSALPELTYQHLGMHIGGESNSAESKRPWFDDIERHEDGLLSCYRLVEKPERGGSYGVDLYVSKAGGMPEVRGSRQKIGGDDFDRCMRDAFARIEFHQPERPTVFSYSILFKLGE